MLLDGEAVPVEDMLGGGVEVELRFVTGDAEVDRRGAVGGPRLDVGRVGDDELWQPRSHLRPPGPQGDGALQRAVRRGAVAGRVAATIATPVSKVRRASTTSSVPRQRMITTLRSVESGQPR